ncbi:hypothetical protein M5K25_004255 [Dendrobium thyrsiflorum]|uniref:Uncharacterized protein n=1 Tax=Dendrobium thyrsiflorum TaxID=117978 RepID=A0ABD0VTP6_DENTH
MYLMVTIICGGYSLLCFFCSVLSCALSCILDCVVGATADLTESLQTELPAIRPYLGVLDPASYTHSNLKLLAAERLQDALKREPHTTPSASKLQSSVFDPPSDPDYSLHKFPQSHLLNLIIRRSPQLADLPSAPNSNPSTLPLTSPVMSVSNQIPLAASHKPIHCALISLAIGIAYTEACNKRLDVHAVYNDLVASNIKSKYGDDQQVARAATTDDWWRWSAVVVAGSDRCQLVSTASSGGGRRVAAAAGGGDGDRWLASGGRQTVGKHSIYAKTTSVNENEEIENQHDGFGTNEGMIVKVLAFFLELQSPPNHDPVIAPVNFKLNKFEGSDRSNETLESRWSSR